MGDRIDASVGLIHFDKDDPVMLANLTKCDDGNYLKEMNNWHLTCSASDVLMLEPLSHR